MRIFKKWTKQSLSWSIWNFFGEMDEAPRGSESPVVWVIASKIHSSRWVTSFKKKKSNGSPCVVIIACWSITAAQNVYISGYAFICLFERRVLQFKFIFVGCSRRPTGQEGAGRKCSAAAAAHDPLADGSAAAVAVPTSLLERPRLSTFNYPAAALASFSFIWLLNFAAAKYTRKVQTDCRLD